MDELTMNY